MFLQRNQLIYTCMYQVFLMLRRPWNFENINYPTQSMIMSCANVLGFIKLAIKDRPFNISGSGLGLSSLKIYSLFKEIVHWPDFNYMLTHFMLDITWALSWIQFVFTVHHLLFWPKSTIKDHKLVLFVVSYVNPFHPFFSWMCSSRLSDLRNIYYQ